ncbi:MAG: hypothetical protein HQ522_00220 [Bacteroidetes bacterium]|nr:hypothetical protein [Bacteroidota bacterium]
MKEITTILILLLSLNILSIGQNRLPAFNKEDQTIKQDWLIDPVEAKAKLYNNSDGNLVFSNGIVSRTYSLSPNVATIGLDHLQTNESFLRSVRPEAEIQIDGITFSVGGLIGQPIHNYLLKEWISDLKADPASFKFTNYRIEETKARFPWKKRLDWMPQDMPWPAPGKEVIFNYKLDSEALEVLAGRALTDESRVLFINDQFAKLSDSWKRFESDADGRNSFINEGKAGEIMALANTAVFADQKIAKGTKVVLAKINPGTDQSTSWGPGVGLVFDNRVVKINLRPKQNQFGFFDGEKENQLDGMIAGKPVWLRLEMDGDKIHGAYSYNKIEWVKVGEVSIPKNILPNTVRVGKMDWMGESSDNRDKGERGRCLIEVFQMLGDIPNSIK